MNRNDINNLKEITTFKQLIKIQNKAASRTSTLDLMLIRKFYFLADECLIIIGPDALDCLEIYKMSHENFFKLSNNEQEYIKHYY